MTKVPNNNWPTVRFGDVVREVRDTERDPLANGIERYIGLEHLDPESLHIKRWGEIADSDITFTRRFRPGQLLFGRRRAYQRKAAIADFDGICSSDIIVMEAKEKHLLPDLLPFIVQSEGFYEYAVKTSAGSLSPRTKWSHLAKYEFALPPKDEQRRIAAILWASETAIERWLEVENTLTAALRKVLFDAFADNEWPHQRLGDFVIESAYGPRFSSDYYSDVGGVGCIRTTDLLEDGTIVYSTVPRADLNPDEFEKHLLQDGDFMISRSGTCGIGSVYQEQGVPMLPGAFLIRLRLKKELSPYFLREYVNSPFGKRHISKLARGAVQKNIKGSQLLEEKIPIPSRLEQEALLKTTGAFRDRHDDIRVHLSHLYTLKKTFLNSMFSIRM